MIFTGRRNRAVLIVAHDFACGFLKGRPYPGRKAEPTLEPLGPQGEKSPPWGQVRPKLATRRMWLARPPISSGSRILTNQRRRSRPGCAVTTITECHFFALEKDAPGLPSQVAAERPSK
jgi:hypothetical protein